MGIVSQGAEGLSGQRRGQREAQRRAKGLKAPEGPRDREKRDLCPTCEGPHPPIDTHVSPEGSEEPVTVAVAAVWDSPP
jgi:hypothetical protein